ncbi:hypothetical protein C8T65DRAFT_739315 [Cerioporus squamosus]|nr:hypothetical protein C8T65DRAFT_739315 [Cerioporus squamosus]
MHNPPQTPTRSLRLEPGIDLSTDHTSEWRTFTDEEVQAALESDRIDTSWLRHAGQVHIILWTILQCFSEAFPGAFVVPAAARRFLEDAPESFRKLVETLDFTGIANSGKCPFVESNIVAPGEFSGNRPGRRVVVYALGKDGLRSRVTVRTAADDLVKCLDLGKEGLAVIVSFDEAHTLTEQLVVPNGNSWSLYAELRRALHIVKDVSIFTLFLSTVVIQEQFSPLPPLGSSSCLMRTESSPYPPIVFTPLDQHSTSCASVSRREP